MTTKDYKATLRHVVAERASWATHDAWTYIFAKSIDQWEKYESEIGGGNMAKLLILFPLWDVLAGVYVFCSEHRKDVVWTLDSAEEAVSGIAAATALLKEQGLGDVARVIGPRANQLKSDAQATQIFLQDFRSHTILGVEPKVFAHTVRQEFRNKLAHTFAPVFGRHATSTGPQVSNFQSLMRWVRNLNDPVVDVSSDGQMQGLNALAMLRDSEKLSYALLDYIEQGATQEDARDSLLWLGFPLD